ncbi:MAG: hypothetical protein JWM53_3846 [bacterium]|nr:hypothetical protein [bacterium]
MRQVYYVQPDGTRSTSRADAIVAAPFDVVAAAAKYSKFSPRHFLGTAQHEADLALNEVDIETTGYTTSGIFQLNFKDEIAAVAPFADPLLLDDAAMLFATQVDRLARALQAAANEAAADPSTPRGVAWPDLYNPPPDAYGYLAWAHNEGLGGNAGNGGKWGPLDSIAKFGMDWEALKARPDQNDYMRLKMIPYGDDCISGGKYWVDAFDVFVPSDGNAATGDTGFLQRLVVLAVVLFLGWQLIAPRLV